ncbi:hypothetical protein [Methylobacter sp.]|uniref:hypothetical protein n=1 Tax=Methylobacter sp. TaxID=2051955 RepID=UPI002FDEF536
MSKSITFKKLLTYSLATAAIVTVSQGAFAHTRLETSSVLEATKVRNNVVIGHGCPPSTARKATIGTSVVFPNAVSYTPVIGVDSTSGGKGTAKVYTTNPASTYYSPLSGIGGAINGGNPWENSNIKADTLGNKDGFWAGGKAYDQTISTNITVPFYSAAVTIAPTSCARTVTFELAIADFCSVAVPSTTAKDEEVLYWSPIPNFTGVPGQPFGAPTANLTSTNLPGGIPVGPSYSNYDGYADAAHTIAGDGWGSPATLKVTRTSALPAGCTGNGGLGDDVYVYPSAAQINAELPVWSGAKQDGTNIWK